ncbi:MAG: hypothetical protein AB7N76_20175 [Planctomycetota bacterium]
MTPPPERAGRAGLLVGLCLLALGCSGAGTGRYGAEGASCEVYLSSADAAPVTSYVAAASTLLRATDLEELAREARDRRKSAAALPPAETALRLKWDDRLEVTGRASLYGGGADVELPAGVEFEAELVVRVAPREGPGFREHPSLVMVHAMLVWRSLGGRGGADGELAEGLFEGFLARLRRQLPELAARAGLSTRLFMAGIEQR